MFGENFKNFNINFHARNERNVFSSGDLVTGEISFDLAKESVITSITLTLKGKVNTAWTVGSNKNRKRLVGRIEYFNFKNVIFMNREAAVQTKIPPGRHVYQFTCQIPQGDFPTSFTGHHGRVLYRLIVGIDRPWHVTKSFETEVNLEARTNPTYELMAPLSGANSRTLCCLCCASGPISMSVHLEKKAFSPGEEVRIRCEFSNASSRPAKSKARLLQKQTVYTVKRAYHRTTGTLLAKLTGDRVPAHSSEVHSQLALALPSNAPSTIANCAIMEVSYFIEVRLCVKYFSDLAVLFPIVICALPPGNVPPPPPV